MAGKNAKKRAKAAKAGVRSLILSKDLWRVVANVTKMAGAMGASTSVAERCRLLAARAEYYLGEPENKRGLVRGELTSEEWIAYRDLVDELGSASPQVKALADAMEVFSDERELSAHEIIDMNDLDEQKRQYALSVCQPTTIEAIIALLAGWLSYREQAHRKYLMARDEDVMCRSRDAVSQEEAAMNMANSAASAMKKLHAILNKLQMDNRPARVAFAFTGKESRTVYSLLKAVQENRNSREVPEEMRRLLEADNLLENAIGFFACLSENID